MNAITKKIKVTMLTILIFVSVSLTCFAIDHRLSVGCAYPDYEVLSVFENYHWEPLDQRITFF